MRSKIQNSLWNLGEWRHEDNCKMCETGLHLTTNPLEWKNSETDIVCIAEAKNIEGWQGDKCVCHDARLLAIVPQLLWDKCEKDCQPLLDKCGKDCQLLLDKCRKDRQPLLDKCEKDRQLLLDKCEKDCQPLLDKYEKDCQLLLDKCEKDCQPLFKKLWLQTFREYNKTVKP
jgi:hypothetical protein